MSLRRSSSTANPHGAAKSMLQQSWQKLEQSMGVDKDVQPRLFTKPEPRRPRSAVVARPAEIVTRSSVSRNSISGPSRSSMPTGPSPVPALEFDDDDEQGEGPLSPISPRKDYTPRSISFYTLMRRHSQTPLETQTQQTQQPPRTATELFDLPSLPIVDGISNASLRQVYLSKCKDLMIGPTGEREQRFFEYCQRNCTNGRLDFCEVAIGSEGCASLSKALANNDEFAYLLLAHNPIGDKGARSLAEMLRHNSSLTVLDLAGTDIGTAGGAALFEALQHNQSVTSINFSTLSGQYRNRLSVSGVRPLVETLKRNQVLHELGLGSNGLQIEGLKSVVEGLSFNSVLSTLDLSGNDLGSDGCILLAEALPYCRLRELDLSRNHIGDDGMLNLANALASRKEPVTVTSLDLSVNNITSVSSPRLFEALRTNVYLQTLNISRNNLGPKGASHLMVALWENDSLTSLSLSQCDLKAVGAAEVAEGLCKNRSIVSVDLSGNWMADDGGLAWCRAIQQNKTLKHLDLSSNRIGEEGGVGIAKALLANKTLDQLNLRDNVLHEEAGRVFSESVKYNSNLKVLNVEYNNIDFKYLQSIEKSIALNNRLYALAAVERYRSEIDDLMTVAEAFRNCMAEVDLKKQKAVETKAKLQRHITALQATKTQFNTTNEDLSAQLFELAEELNQADAIHSELQKQIAETKRRGENEKREFNMKMASAAVQTAKVQKSCNEIGSALNQFQTEHQEEYRSLQEQLQKELDARDHAILACKAAKGNLDAYKVRLEEEQMKRSMAAAERTAHEAMPKLASKLDSKAKVSKMRRSSTASTKTKQSSKSTATTPSKSPMPILEPIRRPKSAVTQLSPPPLKPVSVAKASMKSPSPLKIPAANSPLKALVVPSLIHVGGSVKGIDSEPKSPLTPGSPKKLHTPGYRRRSSLPSLGKKD
eukprot:GILK01012576.1.p1 GENE.GILK01012576.1~~GILK01012576.1.p1  ORF type:complete len:934 (+),score=187.99 GILK01012576.1:39-2840(+)